MSGSLLPQVFSSYEDLFEHAPCGYVVLDLDGQIVQANEAFLEISKLDRNTVAGASFRNLLGAAGAIFFDTQLLPALLLNGCRKEIALDLRTTEGRVPVLVNFTVQYVDDMAVSIRAVLLDAGERRQFERDLLRSRKEAEQLVEVILHSSDAVITSHVDGTIRSWSNGAIEMFGYASCEAVGRPLVEIILPADARDALELPVQRLAQGIEYSGEIVASRADGTLFDASIMLTPHMEAPGTFLAWSAVLRDITAQKLAEKALLQNEKLASVGRLASSIAHEINNPLESVTNLLYILEFQVPTPELRALVTSAQEELARVSQITTHTLQFHRQSSSPTDLKVDALFASVIGLYRARLRNSNIEPRISGGTARPLHCHEGELRQIVLNIVANAADAMKSGGVLNLRCSDSTNWRTGQKGVRILIADTGTGMNKATLAKIFEPFFSTKGIGGTGLGLWVTADLIQKHNGCLAVRSSDRPGRCGTVFNLFFPHVH